MTYVYESPDGGDTVYRRKLGSTERTLHRVSEKNKELTKKIKKTKVWSDIHQAAETDPVLQNMLDQIVTYHTLKNTP